MPPTADGTRRISEQRLCELVGVTAPLRQDWAKKGRLHRRGRDGYGETDAVELAALKAMVDAFGASDGPIAWAAARSAVNAQAGDPDLVVVFDRRDKTALVTSAMSDLRKGAPYGHPVIVADIADPIRRVRQAFGRITADV